MTFHELLEQLQECGQEAEVYSVENRNMLNHDTSTEYFLDKKQAIARAEFLWQQLENPSQGDNEISVHLGAVTYQKTAEQFRFIVHKKLLKAYKKLYVAEAFARVYIAQQKAAYLTSQGASDQAAVAQARNDFNAQYALQPKVAYGMFADYDYAPSDFQRVE